MKKIALIASMFFLTLFVYTPLANGQSIRKKDYNTIAWFSPNMEVRINPKWSVYIEQQFRYDLTNNPKIYQYQSRNGVMYRPNKENSFLIGYVYTWTDTYGDESFKHKFNEDRFYFQYQNKQKLGSSEWITRYRLEQRFQRQGAGNAVNLDTAAIYKNRFRYLVRYNIPLTKKKFEKNGIFLSLYDEIMLSFGKKVKYNVFDQNRVFVGLGYVINKDLRIDCGFFQQLLEHGDGRLFEYNNGVLATLGYTLKLYDEKK